MTSEKYSICICPSADIIDRVTEWKNELRNAIGWYNSVNSKAHITIAEFNADEKQLKIAINHLKEFANKATPFDVAFPHLGTFPNGAFFLSADSPSKEKLQTLMSGFNKSFKIATTTKSNNPHISIGRKLTDEKIRIAQELFNKPFNDFTFSCDRITLRKFDPIQRQFFIESEYLFQAAADLDSEIVQFSLFD